VWAVSRRLLPNVIVWIIQPLLADCGCLLTLRVKPQPARHKYVILGNYMLLTGEAAMTVS